MQICQSELDVFQCNLRRRRALAWLACTPFASMLTACSAPVAPLRVGVIVFPGYELLFLARELGVIDSAKVRLVEMRTNTDTIRALVSSQLEAAAMTLDELMTARADGVDLRAVMVFDISAGADVVLARDTVSLANLAGKRIGVEDGAMGAVMLTALLESAGLKLEQITKVPVTLDRSEEALRRGRVDAVVTANPWASRLEKSGAKRIFDSTAIPGRIVDVLAVRADAMQTHAAALQHLAFAYFAGQRYWLNSPREASAHMAPRLGVDPAEVPGLFRGLELPDVRQNAEMLRRDGRLDTTSRELQLDMQEARLLPGSASVRNVSDDRFLPP